jgi:hypothetical protein
VASCVEIDCKYTYKFCMKHIYFFDVDLVLGPLCLVEVSNVADILEVPAFSIFRVEMSRVNEYSCMYRF